jgi:hypothetical protein
LNSAHEERLSVEEASARPAEPCLVNEASPEAARRRSSNSENPSEKKPEGLAQGQVATEPTQLSVSSEQEPEPVPVEERWVKSEPLSAPATLAVQSTLILQEA